MSRSYKKHPYVTDHKCGVTKRSKRIANRKFRRQFNRGMEVTNVHGFHRKFTCTWDICDYAWYESEVRAIQAYYTYHYLQDQYPTLEDWLVQWRKDCVNK